jgi:hypothetical protein
MLLRAGIADVVTLGDSWLAPANLQCHVVDLSPVPAVCCTLLPTGIADVVTLGDSWLAPAIRRRLVQPITSAETYRWWQRLPRRWQQLVRRDSSTGQPSESGEIWGCPYRCVFLILSIVWFSTGGWGGVGAESSMVQPSEPGEIWGCPYRCALMDSAKRLCLQSKYQRSESLQHFISC